MDIEKVKKVIKRQMEIHAKPIQDEDVAERYYKNQTDILTYKKEKDDESASVRNADNRVPSSFYSLLVNQKASYMFTAPPLFDVGNTESNKVISNVLGDKYAKNCKNLCIKASNAGASWIHYWIDKNKNFKYGILPSSQVWPIWNDSLDRELLGVLRSYKRLDDETGDNYCVFEFWNDTTCEAFEYKESESLEMLRESNIFSLQDALTSVSQPTNIYTHNLGAIPFILFANNDNFISDLDNIKGLIDTYDKTYSGFVNDLEDIQEIIFILTGYGGADLDEFMRDMKKYKSIKLEADEGTGVSTLTINIPVEARDKLLTMTRKAIFEQGQGVDPDPANFGNASGVALKYLYSLLELKAGLMETEFKLGFGELVRAICKFKGIKCDTIIQTWTRTSISNDTELADIASKSTDVISKKTILVHHPWVEDADKEIEQLNKEAKEETESDYSDAFDKGGDELDGKE